jgi:hypothetical protein
MSAYCTHTHTETGTLYNSLRCADRTRDRQEGSGAKTRLKSPTKGGAILLHNDLTVADLAPHLPLP